MRGVCIKDIGPNLFLFQFFHELDLARVMDGNPWTFDQHLLITERISWGIQPNQVELYLVEFWVQVFDLPVGFMSRILVRV